MGFEFKINEELATISVTATELSSITSSITGLIKNADFLQKFNEIVAEIDKSYSVVIESFTPFISLDSEELFFRFFDERNEAFKGHYLLDVSKPRKYCDNVYDAYIQLLHTKEAKSNFPPLKRNFERLHTFYDKWVTNDCLLGMSIDGVLKLMNRLLNEIGELKQKDVEDSYAVFASALADFQGYLDQIQAKSDQVMGMVAPDTSMAIKQRA